MKLFAKVTEPNCEWYYRDIPVFAWIKLGIKSIFSKTVEVWVEK